MTIEEAREYWHRRIERAENYSDEHWDADERHEHADYIDAMKYAFSAITVCIEHKKPKTNADRIRQMTDEELADIFELSDCKNCTYWHNNCGARMCRDGFLNWLKQEVSEDAGTD